MSALRSMIARAAKALALCDHRQSFGNTIALCLPHIDRAALLAHQIGTPALRYRNELGRLYIAVRRERAPDFRNLPVDVLHLDLAMRRLQNVVWHQAQLALTVALEGCLRGLRLLCQ